MRFIKELIQNQQQLKEAIFKGECSSSIASLEVFIQWTKEVVKKISSKKNISVDDSQEIARYIDTLNRHYSQFIGDLQEKELIYSCQLTESEKKSLKLKIDYMHSLKKQFRKDFESIYNSFANLSKGMEFLKRNELLSMMRKAFDFDSSKYNTCDDQLQPLVTKK